MRGIKIPLQDFALKICRGGGGLCARGGVFVGHYGRMKPQCKKFRKDNFTGYATICYLLSALVPLNTKCMHVGLHAIPGCCVSGC